MRELRRWASAGPVRLATNFGYQVVGRLVSAALLIVALGLAVRYLGPTEFGHLTTVIAFYTILLPFTDFGVNATVLRRHASGERLKYLVDTSLGMSVAFTVPITLLAVAVGQALFRATDADQIRLGIVVAAPTLLITSLTTSYLPVFQANRRFGPIALADAASKAGHCTLVLLLVSTSAPTLLFFAAQGVVNLPSLVLLILLAARYGQFRPRFQKPAVVGLARAALPFGVTTLIWATYGRIDALMLSFLRPASDVGLYGVALKLTDAVAAIAIVYNATAFPSLARMFHTDRNRFPQVARWAINGMVLVGLPLTVGGSVLADEIVALVAGQNYSGAGGPLRLLSVGLTFGFLNVLLASLLLIAGDERFLLRLSLVNLALNIVLNFALIGPYGVVGAAGATLITEMLGCSVACCRLQKCYPTASPEPTVVLKALGAAALMALVVWRLGMTPFGLRVTVGGLVYGAALFALRAQRGLPWSEVLRARAEGQHGLGD